MKKSQYNYFISWKDFYYGVNTITGNKIFLCKEDYQKYECIEHLDNLKNKEYISLLESKRFVIPDDVNEFDFIKTRYLSSVFGEDGIFRLTIIPTLDCNLKCWYCYENHIKSKMADDVVSRIELFVDKLCSQRKIRILHIDWFGGEPLLYFDEIIYPLSIKIEQILKKYNVSYHHSITTNGVLINTKRICKFKEIGLSDYQITVDGYKSRHDSSRTDKYNNGTYDTIIANINELASSIKDAKVTVRVNYTNKTFDNIYSMIDDILPLSNIHFFFQKVWQYRDNDQEIYDNLERIGTYINNRGNKYEKRHLPYNQRHSCYADEYNQIVINYNGELYKCTARDFAKKDGCCGYIESDGSLNLNSYFYKRFAVIPLDRQDCKSCLLLPVCLGGCSQKNIESSNFLDFCMKKDGIIAIKEELYEDLVKYIESKINRKL